MSGTGRRIVLHTTTPKPTPRTAYTLHFKSKAADAKAIAKTKKEHVELYFFPYTLS
jgi:hypothetical protein